MLSINLKKKRNYFINPSKETVREFIYRWLPIRSKLEKWEYSYLNTATGLLENHVIPEIGDLIMQNVSPLHIDSMFSKLQEKRCDGPKSYNREVDEIPFLSGSTLGSIYTLVKCFFETAVTWRFIEENPVTTEKPERDEVEDKIIWDLGMIITALANIKDEQLHLMVHLASAHTCRNGEVCGLTWEAIDFDKGLVKIDRVIQRVNKKTFGQLPKRDIFRIFPNKVNDSKSFLVLKTPKTKSSIRWLYLTKPILNELMHRKQQVENDKAIHGSNYNNYDLVFCYDDGTPIKPNRLEKWFIIWQKRNGEKLSLPYIKFHGLRHSSTTLLMQLSGSDAKTVQAITGHSSAKFVFDVYNHPLMDNHKQLVKKLELAMYGTVPRHEYEINQVNISLEDILSAIRKNPLLHKEVVSALYAKVANNTTQCSIFKNVEIC
jgi:integrase